MELSTPSSLESGEIPKAPVKEGRGLHMSELARLTELGYKKDDVRAISFRFQSGELTSLENLPPPGEA